MRLFPQMTGKPVALTLLMAMLLSACAAVPPTPPPTVYLAGDSTIADKADNRRPETGWGERLSVYLDPAVKVANHARNGRSTKSFRREGLWDEMMSSVRPGDYVLIEFGHNDSKTDTARYSSPETYAENLAAFVRDVRERDANPILLTPIVRRKFGMDGDLLVTHGGYPSAVRYTAKRMNVPLIDLNALTRQAVNSYGPDRSRELYLWLAPGAHENYPDGVEDDTHLNPDGAKFIAGLVARDINRLKLPLRKYLIRSSLPRR